MYAGNSADAAIKYLEGKYGDTIDYSKILIGAAAYTRGWGGVKDDGLDEDNPGLFASAKANSVTGPDGSTDGSYGFSDFDKMIEEYDLEEYFDDKAKAPYYYNAKKGYFFTGDNEESVAAKGKYVKEKGLGGIIMWMASQDAENKLTKTMFNSMFGKDYKFPKQEVIYTTPDVEAKIKENKNGYEITVVNNEEIVEENDALKYAELFQKTILFMKLYIKTKSGAEFSVGTGSGTVKNNDGIAVIDPSSSGDAKSISPGEHYSFNVRVSGDIDSSDIVSIKMTQRILPTLDEFKEQIIYEK